MNKQLTMLNQKATQTAQDGEQRKIESELRSKLQVITTPADPGQVNHTGADPGQAHQAPGWDQEGAQKMRQKISENP